MIEIPALLGYRIPLISLKIILKLPFGGFFLLSSQTATKIVAVWEGTDSAEGGSLPKALVNRDKNKLKFKTISNQILKSKRYLSDQRESKDVSIT